MITIKDLCWYLDGNKLRKLNKNNKDDKNLKPSTRFYMPNFGTMYHELLNKLQNFS